MRHLLSIADLTREDIERILDRAAAFEQIADREVKKVPALRGRTVLNLFYEASTRTRSSFELAAKRLSADVVNFAASGSSVEKGESLKDTVLTLGAHSPDAIVIRSPHAGAAALVAGWTSASVVNAGDGKHEHPTQALLDVHTLRSKLGGIDGRSIWIVGDIAHSRVARSNILAFRAMGAHVTLVGPPTLMPRDIEALGCDVRYDLDDLREADVVYALRVQRERMDGKELPSLREYAARYQINGRRLHPRQVLMHPGPVNRGVELSRRGRRLAAGRHHHAGRAPASSSGWRCSTSCSPGRGSTARRGCGSPSPRERTDPHTRARASRRRCSSAAPTSSIPSRASTRCTTSSSATARSPRSARPAGSTPAPAPRSSTGRASTCCPRSSTRTCTCAPPARSTRRTSRRAPAPPPPAASARSSAMANTDPVVDTAPILGALLEAAARDARIPVGFMACVTRGMDGRDLTEMAELADVGAFGFTDDGRPIADAGVMRRALQYQRLAGRVIALHEEDMSLSGAGAMHEGAVSARLGVAGIPSVSESTLVARDCLLAGYEDARIHLQHLSCVASVEAVAAAKAAGVQVTCEASPHHLTLTDEDVAGLDTRMKMNPPLRTETDRKALIDGLRDGTIDCIATDHAPHARDEKEVAVRAGADGHDRPGDLLRRGLHRARRSAACSGSTCSSTGCAAAASRSASRSRRSRSGSPRTSRSSTCERRWVVGENGYESRSENCCFAGRELQGKVLLTVAAGAVAYRERAFALTAAK